MSSFPRSALSPRDSRTYYAEVGDPVHSLCGTQDGLALSACVRDLRDNVRGQLMPWPSEPATEGGSASAVLPRE